MSINYCTLASSTVDSFCGTQRAKVLARLIVAGGFQVVTPPPPPPPAPSHGGHGASGGIQWAGAGLGQNSTFQPSPRPTYRPRIERPEEEPRVIEQPFITVTAEVFGLVGSETLDVVNRLDFVTVTDLQFAGAMDPALSVNITEMEM